MPLKIPPFTPVPIQPTSAEPFSTFVNNTPLAQTPLTGTELIPVIQGGVSKHTPPGSIGGGGSLTVGTTPVASGTTGFALIDNAGVLGDTPVRTVLTANTNFYVATTGNDSNSGSITSKWATLQHALIFIGSNIDFAGFSVIINLGAGTFVGAGTAGASGGGNLTLVGAGVASTSITAGPNDGVINFGECLDVDLGIGSTILNIDNLSFKVPETGSTVFGLAAYVGVDIFVGLNTPVNFDTSLCTTGNSYLVTAQFPSSQINFATVGTGAITITGGGTIFGAFFVFGGGQISNDLPWTITGGLTHFGFAQGFAAGIIAENTSGASYTGAATGPRYALTGGSMIISGSSAGTLGPNFYPGNSDGTADQFSSYDGFPGPLPGIDTQTGASYTLSIGDAFGIVEMNNAGANTLTVPTNASVPFLTGTKIWVIQIGTGATTIAGAGGVTVDNAGAVGGRWKSAKLYKRGTNEWVQTNA